MKKVIILLSTLVSFGFSDCTTDIDLAVMNQKLGKDMIEVKNHQIAEMHYIKANTHYRYAQVSCKNEALSDILLPLIDKAVIANKKLVQALRDVQ